MWRRRARSGVLFAIAAVSIYLLLPSVLAVFASWRSLTSLAWPFAAAALAAEALSTACICELDRIALHTRAWGAVAAAQLGGAAAGRVLPGGGATAGAVTVSLLRREGFDAGRAGAALGAAGGLQLATRLALPLLTLPAILGGVAVNRSLADAAYLGLAALAALLAGGVAAFTSDRPVELAGRALQWLLNGTVRRGRPITGLSTRLLADRDAIRATLGRHWRTALASAAGATAFDYLALLAALRAVGAHPRPSLVLLAYAASTLFSSIPLTPGGLGFVEAGLVGALTLAGVGGEDALAATFLYRVVSYWLPIPVGGAAYLALVRKSRTDSAASPIRSGAATRDSGEVNRNDREVPGIMESTFDRATKEINTQLTKFRWALGLNGLLSVAAGVVIIAWPGISLYALTIVFGAYSLAVGVVSLMAGIRAPSGYRAWPVVNGLLGIAVGVLVFVWPNISALALLYVIGAYAVALGVIAVFGAFSLPLDGGDTALMILSGLVSILFGIVMFARPGAGALVVLALIAAFALVTGITELVVAIGGKRLVEGRVKRAFTPKPAAT